MNEAFASTIEHLKDQMKPLEEQLITKKKLINDLCVAAGEAPIYPDVSAPSIGTSLVRPDQYFGRPMATVVREILERRKALNLGAIPLNDLYDAMKVGGFEFSTKDEANAKIAVATTLGKNPAFIKVPNTGSWGLAEWYPGAKRNKAEDTSEKPETKAPTAATTPPPDAPPAA